ncbi:MAG: hypothetical protein MUO22_01070 [Sedimentisphaerales bacterium]|nr:hypothetical protein [Sedimentisphaerales bacterium]
MHKVQHIGRKGSAITLVLLAVVILFVAGTGLLSIGFQSQILSIRMTSDIAARLAADAGLTEAVYKMNEHLKIKPWDDLSLPYAINSALPNSEALYSYTVYPESTSLYRIESMGDYGVSSRTVRCSLGLQTPFEYAIFMQDSIDLRNGTTIDWYNFDGDDELQIGTNSVEEGAIDAHLGVTINGDVVVGFEGDIDTVINSRHEAVITGDTYALSEEYELPPITVPAYLEVLVSGGTITNSVTLWGMRKYDSICLSPSEVITIAGPTILYVTGDVVLDNASVLEVVDANTNPDAFLILYLGGNLICRNEGVINNQAKDATKIKIYGLESCENIDFYTTSTFYGAIYAPNADVRLHNAVEFFGAVVAESFVQFVSADFHYDATLNEGTVNDECVSFVIKRWSE